MAERQMSVTREGVRGDHLQRYRYAAGRVAGDVLDLGCGTGYGAQLLAQQPSVWTVTGWDYSGEALQIARDHYAHHKASYRLTDLARQAELVFPPGGFHWAVAFEILEHLEAPLPLLARLRQNCPRLLCSVPNQALLPFDAGRFPFHRRHYHQAELRQLLEEAGWQVVQWMHQVDAHEGLLVAGPGGRTLIAEAQACE